MFGEDVEADAGGTGRRGHRLDRLERAKGMALAPMLGQELDVVDVGGATAVAGIDRVPGEADRRAVDRVDDLEQEVARRVDAGRKKLLEFLTGAFLRAALGPSARRDVVLGIAADRRREVAGIGLGAHRAKRRHGGASPCAGRRGASCAGS